MELELGRLTELKTAITTQDIAHTLNIDVVFLTHCLYVVKPKNQYHEFEIDKKSGGKRIISAPSANLKSLQSSLSILLLDCVDEINKTKYPNSQLASPKMLTPTIKDPVAETLKIKIPSVEKKQLALSHGFVRERSIITNAMMHLGKKNVLNIDLDNFFGSFNFGRVRGFFIKNQNFQLHPKIATIIAQIACYKDKLPQGSPCSPVITNLISHSLDIRLATLASKYKCTYTRYADDITFSTRKSIFPPQIMRETESGFNTAKRLKREISHAGFSINDKKTRIQYKDSRQDVTGIIVNKKPNTKKEYWRIVRAKCDALFKTGKFESIENGLKVDGNINQLEGQLSFIDQLDHYNRMRQKQPLSKVYSTKSLGVNTKPLLTGRETTYRRFLYYRFFYGNEKPTILCEGKTDNVYLKSAISSLVAFFPKLATGDPSKKDYQLSVRFIEHSKKLRFLLQLFGGTSYLNYFITEFTYNFNYYKAPLPNHPVILVLDNDKGFTQSKGVLNTLITKCTSAKPFPTTLNKDDFRNAEFIHIAHNLYIVLTPIKNDVDTMIESLFDKAAWGTLVGKKSFNPDDARDNNKEYGKEVFSQKVVKAGKSKIKFDGFKPLLARIVNVIEHYDSIK
jgi:RNA-directed DNA polymerase